MDASSESHAWSADEIRRVGYRVVDLIADYLTQLPDGPVFQPVPSPVVKEFGQEPLPAEGQSVDTVLDEFSRRIAPYPFGNGHPRFFGWVNSPPAVIGVFAEALAATMNPSVAGGNHAAVYVERQVVGWLRAMIGFPESAHGLLVSGGSVAALTALTVARTLAARRARIDVRIDGIQSAAARFAVYKGSEAHACNDKAVELLGLGSANLRKIESTAALRMRPDALERALSEDADRGIVPVAVVASAGTVNTGAIDPLDEIADVCGGRGVWLHVDAAYGAPAILSRQYEPELRALTRADSVALDPHKWMYVPVEAGLVIIKDAQAMRDTFSLIPPYLRTDGNAEGVQGLPWFSEFGIQQTRGFRALKVWMALKHLGFDGYRATIEHDLANAAYLAKQLRAADDFECWEPQSLSIVCFRWVPPAVNLSADDIDALNRALLTTVQLGGSAFLSSTVIEGRFWLRACLVNPLTRESDLDVLVETVRAAGNDVRCTA